MNEERLTIVKTEVQQTFGLYHWHLFGLNIFDYNAVACSLEKRPDVLFLTDLTSRIPCSAHVGSLALKDIVDTPEEMFGEPQGRTPFLRTRVGYHDGFYNLEEYPCFDACFFPQVTSLFWQTLLREENLEQLLLNHGLAFYVAPHPGAMAQMESLLLAPFAGEAQWLNAVTALFALVVTVGHDGQFFHAYAKSGESLRLMEPSLTVATKAVEASEWFRSHKQELIWSDDLDCCLMLPR